MPTKQSSRRSSGPFKSRFVSRASGKPKSGKRGKKVWPSTSVRQDTFKIKDDFAYGAPVGFTAFTSKTAPCIPKSGQEALKPGACKVQLTFKAGKTYLRFCRRANSPGPLIPVKSAREARKFSNELCACLKATRGGKSGSGWRAFMDDCLGGRKYELGSASSCSKPKPKRGKRRD
jgi:hypothetical protein